MKNELFLCGGPNGIGEAAYFPSFNAAESMIKKAGRTQRKFCVYVGPTGV